MKVVVLAVRFLAETAAWVGLGVFGWWLADGWLRPVVAVSCSAVAVAFWGVLISPKSPWRLRDPSRLIVEFAYWALAGVALGVAWNSAVGVALAVVGATTSALVRITGDADTIGTDNAGTA